MPRPMTTYRSGIRKVPTTRFVTCGDCGRHTSEHARFVGIDAVEQALAWQAATPDRCSRCRIKARRAA